MKVNKSVLANYISCDDCEFDLGDTENSNKIAIKHVRETGHNVTVTKMFWFTAEVGND